MRYVLAVALTGCVLIATAWAQPVPVPLPGAPATPGATTPTTGETPSGNAGSTAELNALIATLEDETARNQLIARLRALAAAEHEEGTPDPIAGAIEGLSNEVSSRADVAGQALVGLLESVRELPVLMSWLGRQLSDPSSRGLWWAVGRQLGVAAIAGLFAWLLIRLTLQGWRDRLGTLPIAASRRRRVKASLAYLAVDLAALAALLAVAYGVVHLSGVSVLAERVADDILTGVALAGSLRATVAAVLAGDNPRRRVMPLDDEVATAAQSWLRGLLGLSIYGYFVLEAARRLGLPWAVHGFLLHFLFFVVTAIIVYLIYRLRNEFGAAVERWGGSSTSAVARYLPWWAISAIGHHVVAAWVTLVYLAWAVDWPGGAVFLTRGVLATVAVLLLLRAFHVWLNRRTVQPTPVATPEGEEVVTEPPAASAGRVSAIAAVRFTATVLALGLILQAWEVDVVGWLRSDAGQVLLATLTRVLIVVALVIGGLRAINFAANRYIKATDSEGNPLHGNRTRTLASMARNVAITLLVVTGVLNVLGQLGVNTTALLAGAGVAGLAIGFGSQKLVQDLITGLFILVGDTVRVGDVVDLGGKAGVVEAISMRTIVLRDYNGNVHTIPYSSIDVVTNMTKDFSFYVFDVRVAYKEDVDRVMEALREIDSQLRREWPYRRLMLEPLEIAGVDAFQDAGVLIKARTKVRAGEQWKVGREFNRRIKKRFDELGIEIPVPHQKVLFGEAGGDAPPHFIERRREELTERKSPAMLDRVAGQS